jgi:hypothetical protein
MKKVSWVCALASSLASFLSRISRQELVRVVVVWFFLSSLFLSILQYMYIKGESESETYTLILLKRNRTMTKPRTPPSSFCRVSLALHYKYLYGNTYRELLARLE